MTERSESERAELEAIAGQIEIFIKYGTNAIFEPDDAKKIASALRRLAAQDQKPVAYLHSHPKGIDNLTRYQLTDSDKEHGWIEKPLYSDPPPAAGWDGLARAYLIGRGYDACRIDDLKDANAAEWQVALQITKALRHNAPPDSGAGKSEPTNKATNNFIRDAFCNLKEHELREAIKIICKNMPPPDPSAMPDHGGADAGVANRKGIYIASKTKHADRWRFLRDKIGEPIISTWIDEAGEGETSDFHDLWNRCLREAAGCRILIAYREKNEVLKGGWVEIGAALSAGVPVYAVGLEEFTLANYRGITHFPDMKSAIAAARSALSHHHAPVAANASAEAQLRKALEQIIRYCDESTDPVIALTAKKALSAHPHASDCDKQGER